MTILCSFPNPFMVFLISMLSYDQGACFERLPELRSHDKMLTKDSANCHDFHKNLIQMLQPVRIIGVGRFTSCLFHERVWTKFAPPITDDFRRDFDIEKGIVLFHSKKFLKC